MKLGSTSKRTPLARKYNITKKAKEHDRKLKRDAKKNPKLRKKLHKDPGIPNLNPFKEKILKQLEEQKKMLHFAEQQRTRRAQALAAHRKLGAGSDLAGLAADAAARSAVFDRSAAASAGAVVAASESAAPASAGRAGEQTRRAFFKHIKVLLEKADILLVVLDARDPLACRAPAVEALALSLEPPKRVVLVLNKIDLVPPEVVRAWLAYLRRDFPTVAFKASTQQQRDHLASRGGAAVNKATEAGEAPVGTGAAGADTLLQLIKNYSRSHALKTAVTVGVIGYPNVGKSSVINSLKRSRAVGVSPTPGFTRTLQEVSLDAKVTLIDCPGIIFDDDGGGGATSAFGASEAGAGLLLRNCVSVDSIEDPEGAVDAILRRCAPAKLVALYGISLYDSTADFLRQIATKRGKLGKGGIPDKDAAARSVLHDWNTGKIPFFVLPPGDAGAAAAAAAASEDADMGAASAAGPATGGDAASGLPAHSLVSRDESDVGATSIVQGWSKEFDLDSLLKQDAEVVSAAAAARPLSNVAAPSTLRQRRPSGKAGAAAAARLAAALAAADEEEEEGGMADETDDDEDADDDDNEHEKLPAPAAAAAAGSRRRQSAAAPAPAPAPAPSRKARRESAAAVAVEALAAAPVAEALSQSAAAVPAAAGDAYNFQQWFGAAARPPL